MVRDTNPKRERWNCLFIPRLRFLKLHTSVVAKRRKHIAAGVSPQYREKKDV